MIVSFDYKALSQLYCSDKAKGLPPALVEKLNVILTALDSATSPSDLPNFPGWRMHRLKGDLRLLVDLGVRQLAHYLQIRRYRCR